MCCLFQHSLEEADLHSPDVEFFEAELVKGTQGLGITIAGYIGERTTGTPDDESEESSYIIFHFWWL